MVPLVFYKFLVHLRTDGTIQDPQCPAGGGKEDFLEARRVARKVDQELIHKVRIAPSERILHEVGVAGVEPLQEHGRLCDGARVVCLLDELMDGRREMPKPVPLLFRHVLVLLKNVFNEGKGVVGQLCRHLEVAHGLLRIVGPDAEQLVQCNEHAVFKCACLSYELQSRSFKINGKMLLSAALLLPSIEIRDEPRVAELDDLGFAGVR